MTENMKNAFARLLCLCIIPMTIVHNIVKANVLPNLVRAHQTKQAVNMVQAQPLTGAAVRSGGSCVCNSGYTGNANTGCTPITTCVAGGSKSCTGVTSCGSGQKASSSCKDCNGTTRYTCVSSCVAGGSKSCSGQTSSCSSSQVQTSSCTDCNGTKHYSCRNKTCAEQGKKDCNGSCISKSECCGGCSSGYTCQNGSCVKKTCTKVTCDSSYSTLRVPCSGKGLVLEYCTPVNSDCTTGTIMYKCTCQPYFDPVTNRWVQCSYM